MTASPDHLLFREAVRRGPVVPDVHDLAAWAPLLGQDGALLRDCAALIAGVPGPAPSGRSPSTTGWTLEIAIGELEDVARRVTPLLVSPDRPRPSGRPDCALGIGPVARPAVLPADLGAAVRALTAVLVDPAEPDLAALSTGLAGLAEMTRRLPVLDYRSFADAPADLLATAIAASVLGDFVLGIRDLAQEPLGSPILFHRSARFSTAGLGPWFANVGRIVRNSRDVFDLARMACRTAGDASDDAVGAWIALLSRGCGGQSLRHLVDDLADYGAMAPLAAILDRTLSRPVAGIDVDLIMYLRDAALDNGDHDFAARAQAGIVRSRPARPVEQEILGTILAGGGDLRGAEATFRAALAIDPGNAGIGARLAALGTSAFAPFLIRQGFASPADRAHTRLHRRGIPVDYACRQGERIAAVDVH